MIKSKYGMLEVIVSQFLHRGDDELVVSLGGGNLDQLKKDLVVFAMIASDLKSIGKSVKDYIDIYDDNNKNVVGDIFKNTFSLNGENDAKEVIKTVINETYNRILEHKKLIEGDDK